MTRSKGTSGKAVLWALGGASLFLLILILILLPGYLRGSDVDRAIESLRKKGVPVRVEDLRRKPSVEDSQNAAIAYKSLADAKALTYPELESVRAIARLRAAQGNAADKSLILANLKRIEPALSQIEQASKLPFCDPHWKFESGELMLMSEIQVMRYGARYLAWKAHMESESGNDSAAIKTLQATMRVVGHMDQLEGAISAIEACKAEDEAMIEVRLLLLKAARDKKKLAQVKELLDSFPRVPQVRHALGGELVIELQTLSRAIALAPVAKFLGPPSTRDFASASPDGMKLSLLNAWKNVFRTLPEDEDIWPDVMGALEEDDDSIGALQNSGKKEDTYGAGSIPSLTVFGRQISEVRIVRNLVNTSILLLKDRAANGKVPSKLPSFKNTSTDPMTGNPLHYKRMGHGFQLYSVGLDERDDGGRDRGTLPFGRKGYDEVIALP